MTGTDLIDALKASGTGDGKLAPARAVLVANPKAGALELYQAMIDGGAPLMTLKKCRDLMGLVGTADVAPAFPVRAPQGGCSVGAVAYAPGQVVPAAAVQAATPDEIRTLCADSLPASPPPAPPPALDAGAGQITPPKVRKSA